MGLWNFIKRLFTLAFSYLWNWITRSFRSQTSPRPGSGKRQDVRSGHTEPTSKLPSSPIYKPAYKGIRGVGNYLEKYGTGSKESVRGPAYPLSYAADTLRGYPSRGIHAYTGSPLYRGKLDDLYEHSDLIYDKSKSGYQRQAFKYSE